MVGTVSYKEAREQGLMIRAISCPIVPPESARPAPTRCKTHITHLRSQNMLKLRYNFLNPRSLHLRTRIIACTHSRTNVFNLHIRAHDVPECGGREDEGDGEEGEMQSPRARPGRDRAGEHACRTYCWITIGLLLLDLNLARTPCALYFVSPLRSYTWLFTFVSASFPPSPGLIRSR